MNKKFKEYMTNKKKQAVYTLTKAQIDDIKIRATKQAVEKSMSLLLVLPVKILKEHYGFSRKKLENFCSFISDEYEKIPLETMNLEECGDFLYNEVGVKFVINEE